MRTGPWSGGCAMVPAVVLALAAVSGFSRPSGTNIPPPGGPVVLQPIYRVQSGDGFMTTTKADGSLKVVGQPAYLAKNAAPGTVPLYRYKNPEGNIFRDAHVLGPPWVREKCLGNTWKEGRDRVLLRQYRDPAGRYITLNAHENIPDRYEYVCDLGYGYERFGMDLTRFLSLKRGDVEVRFDRVAGGCVWHLLHKGVQMVNNAFYGRQVCVALDLYPGRDHAEDSERYCACDCGLTAGLAQWFTNPAVRMGSPCPVFARQDGDSVLIRTLPVESNAGTNRRLGGGPLNPVVYSDLAFEKRVDIGLLGRDGIIKFKLKCTSRAGWAGMTKTRVNICGIHLCEFMDRLVLYDPATGTGTEDTAWRTSPVNRQFVKRYLDKEPMPKDGLGNFSCVVLHDGKDNAVGLMGAAPGKGPGGQGSVESFLGYHWKQLGKGIDGAEFGDNTIMMTAMNGLPMGKDGGSYVVYLLVGSPGEVEAYARELYANRADMEW